MNIKPQITFLKLIIEYCKATDTDTYACMIKEIKADIKHIKFLAEHDSDRLAEFLAYTIFADFLNGKVDFQGVVASLCLYY